MLSEGLAPNAHMGYQAGKDKEDEEEHDVLFLYKLCPGPTESSFGLNVAKMAGLPHKIVAKAATIATHFQAMTELKFEL